MRTETVQKLCCPFDKQELVLEIVTQNDNGEVINGILACESCKKVFPIVYGIPILAPDEYRDYKLEQPLMERFKRELGSDTLEKMGLESKY